MKMFDFGLKVELPIKCNDVNARSQSRHARININMFEGIFSLEYSKNASINIFEN